MTDASPDAQPGNVPAPAVRTVAVRYRPGVIGESQRQSHMAQTTLHDLSRVPYWTTACGQIISADVAEVSEQPAGMPCLRCLIGLPVPLPGTD